MLKEPVHKLLIVAIAFAMLTLALPVSALPATQIGGHPEANVLVVDDDGAECPDAPFDTIQDAVDAAPGGFTVRVCSGTYNEEVTIRAKNAISLVADSAVLLDGEGVRNVGIYALGSPGVHIQGFEVRDHNQFGIRVEASPGAVVRDNAVYNNGEDGIHVQRSAGVEVVGNTVAGHVAWVGGIRVAFSTFAVVRDNTAHTNSFAIIVEFSDGALVQNNIAENHRRTIYVYRSINVVVEGNVISDGIADSKGIYIQNAEAVRVSNNRVSAHYRGIDVTDSPLAIVQDNAVPANFFGISLSNSQDSVISTNTATGSIWDGIFVSYSTALIQNNTASDNARDGINLWNADESEVTGNVITGNDRGGIVLTAGSTGVVVEKNGISGNIYGLVLAFSDNVQAQDNVIDKNGLNGVEVVVSDGLTARHNRINDNGQAGINVIGATGDNRFESNTIIGDKTGVRVSGPAPSTVLRQNNLQYNAEAVGLDATGTPDVVDATENWWGCGGGPGDSACEAVLGNATTDAWLREPNEAAGPRDSHQDGGDLILPSASLSAHSPTTTGNPMGAESVASKDLAWDHPGAELANGPQGPEGLKPMSSLQDRGTYLDGWLDRPGTNVDDSTEDRILHTADLYNHDNLVNEVPGTPLQSPTQSAGASAASLETADFEAACAEREAHGPITIESDADFEDNDSGVVAGGGTASDPYVIEGWCITQTEEDGVGTNPLSGFTASAVYITGTDAHVVIRDNVVLMEEYVPTAGVDEDQTYDIGVHIRYSANVTLSGNAIFQGAEGFSIDGSPGILIEGNTITGAKSLAIEMRPTDEPSHGAVLRNNTIAYNGGNYLLFNTGGVYIRWAANLVVENNNISNNDYAGLIVVSNSTTTVRNNTFSDNVNMGAAIYHYDGSILVRNNTATHNSVGIALLRGGGGHVVEENIITNNGQGIAFSEANHDDVVRGNIVTGNTGGGIVLVGSNANVPGDEVSIEGNTVTDNDGTGITLWKIAGGTVENNTVSDNSGHGVYLATTEAAVIQGNSITSNVRDGVHVFNTEAPIVRANTVTKNDGTGLHIDFSKGATVSANEASGNAGHGIQLWLTHDASVHENNAVGNGADGIHLWNSDRVIVQDNAAEHAATGVGVLRSSATIQNNIVANNQFHGIRLSGAHDVSVSGNDASDNAGHGVHLDDAFGPAEHSRVEANQVTRNGVGAVVSGAVSGTVLDANNIHDNAHGVGLDATNAVDAVDATGNWWGCADGPDDDACDSVLGTASFLPWLIEDNPDAGAS